MKGEFLTVDIPSTDLHGNYINFCNKEDFYKIIEVLDSMYPEYDFVQIVTNNIYATVSSNVNNGNGLTNIMNEQNLNLGGYIILRRYTIKDTLETF